MGAMTGLLAGLATVGGAIALSKLITRNGGAVRRVLDEARHAMDAAASHVDAQERDQKTASETVRGPVLDYECDPATGVYRAKP